MSTEIAKNLPNPQLLENLSDGQKRFLFGFVNLNIYKMELSWDLDQTLEITEDSVKAFTDVENGTNYFNRRVDGWNSIANWLVEDKIMDKEEAYAYEHRLWTNNDILMMGPPNIKLRDLSFAANQREIPQSVTTVRVCGLRQTTYRWLDEHYPWIAKGNINFRIGMNPTGFEYKISKILTMYKSNPNLIHIDDDLKIIKVLVEKAPGLGIVGILCPNDDVSDIKYADNRVFLSRDDLNSLIYYSPLAGDMVAQSH